jgi:hypothetical protein
VRATNANFPIRNWNNEPSRIRTYIRNLEGFRPNPLDDGLFAENGLPGLRSCIMDLHQRSPGSLSSYSLKFPGWIACKVVYPAQLAAQQKFKAFFTASACTGKTYCIFAKVRADAQQKYFPPRIPF